MLGFLKTRRSVREFEPRPVPRDVLERLVEAAASAPSATNRQPWRFSVVVAAELRRQIHAVVRARVSEIEEVARQGHHAGDLGGYLDYFHKPLESAQAVVVAQYRTYPDLVARLIESSGGTPSRFLTGEQMQAEICSTSAAVMALLLQAHAEGLGACWMTGPLVAREEISGLLGISSPWRPMAVIALGWPRNPGGPQARRPLSQMTQWHEDAPPQPDGSEP